MSDISPPRTLPARFERASPLRFVLLVACAAAIISSIHGSQISISALVDGLPQIGRLVGDMFPPDISRLPVILLRLLETFQMALAGTFIGIILSLPIAVLATRDFSPHPVVRFLTKGLVSFCRTIPDLIWALIFVVAVGLGPFAGTLAIIVDTIGFCGRFFAEAMEDVEKGPQEALTALGASRTDIIASAVVPGAMPAMIATGLFSLEKATRGSVVLGIVGAGGIGVELQVALDLFNYAQAATIIFVIFVLVLAVEQVGSALRARILVSGK
ncbi:phosphonate ABC transporter, permease protein PhnE [Mesorhizobium retamae]|uniref:Phosphonate ABC transporter, permease protein PhnE n=1 Tax=Mesorhizobium retamae TaxID=2912854 RepID=A0ABS9QDC9_9HYPH|nr:phosphonate ABC transporter, permease protein PhnE [Mesorhizobium sp. IRAMC:0171]MCG7505426.1 phosphonate ABC transporter, permease protein PhnE [Mesorhizobium sp. IRAMC:0171]